MKCLDDPKLAFLSMTFRCKSWAACTASSVRLGWVDSDFKKFVSCRFGRRGSLGQLPASALSFCETLEGGIVMAAIGRELNEYWWAPVCFSDCQRNFDWSDTGRWFCGYVIQSFLTAHYSHACFNASIHFSGQLFRVRPSDVRRR